MLLELLSDKESGYLPGLSYLDTAQGINPTVEKLPSSFRDKWLSVGSHYKEEFNVCFPPFSFLMDFVKGQVKGRNDPGFILTNTDHGHYHSERTTTRYDTVRTAVSTRKTDVSATSHSSPVQC